MKQGYNKVERPDEELSKPTTKLSDVSEEVSEGGEEGVITCGGFRIRGKRRDGVEVVEVRCDVGKTCRDGSRVYARESSEDSYEETENGNKC